MLIFVHGHGENVHSDLVGDSSYTVDSGNSKRLNSEQSLISKHFLVQTPIVL